MKKTLLLFTFFIGLISINAQTLEELKATQSAKKDSIAAIQGRVDAIQGQIDALPGWKKGALVLLAEVFLALKIGLLKVRQIIILEILALLLMLLQT